MPSAIFFVCTLLLFLLFAGTVKGDLGYLRDLLGVRGAGLQHFHLLVNVRRVHPLALEVSMREGSPDELF